MLPIHNKIISQLDNFIEKNNIPNILFYGENGAGKKELLHQFINKIYNNVNNKKEYIMYINCCQNKGIKFIRDELKFFAKTNIQTINSTETIIKSVIFINAEFLTFDAQSALRRCIELFSKSTRFFMVTTKRDALMIPIISRFCNIYVPNPILKNKVINLHQYKKFEFIDKENKKQNSIFKKVIQNLDNSNIIEYSNELYENGCSGISLLQYLENQYIYKNDDSDINNIEDVIFLCSKMKSEVKNEKIFIMMILNSYLMRNNITLENIDIM